MQHLQHMHRPKTVSFRVPESLARRVAERAAAWGVASESDIYRRVIDEWLRMQEHPGIRFVDGPTGRRAALVRGPDVWEVIDLVRRFEAEADRLADAFPWLDDERLEAARRYYDAYPEEIDARIEQNARAAQELEHELRTLGA